MSDTTIESRKSVSFNLQNNQSCNEKNSHTNHSIKSILKNNDKTWDNLSSSSTISSFPYTIQNIDMTTLEEQVKGLCNHSVFEQQCTNSSYMPKDKVRNYYKAILGLGSFKEARKLKKNGFTSSLINAIVENKNKYICHAYITTSGFTMHPYESILIGRLSTAEYFNSSLVNTNNSEKRVSRILTCNITPFTNPKKQVGPLLRATTFQHHDHDCTTNNIVSQITSFYEQALIINDNLKQIGKKLSIMITIDDIQTIFGVVGNEIGSKHNEDFLNAVKNLETLEVSIVIYWGAATLTDFDQAEHIYKKMESELSKSIMIRDYSHEIQKMNQNHKWLNYSLPLHRCREIGCSKNVLKALNKQKLTMTELKNLLEFLFDDDPLPDPTKDWKSFRTAVKRSQSETKYQWNPIKQTFLPWIDLKKMHKEYCVKKRFRWIHILSQ